MRTARPCERNSREDCRAGGHRIPPEAGLEIRPVRAADRRRLVERLAASDADAVILDLEDSVAEVDKPAAREAAAEAITWLSEAGRQVVVRINAEWRTAFRDLEAVVRPGLIAVMVPKAERRSRLKTVSELIEEVEPDRGMVIGETGVIALVETSAALPRLPSVASSPRMLALALGPEDLATSIGVEPSPAVLDLPCQMVAQTASVRDLMALGAPVSIANYRDVDGFVAAMRRPRAMGMTGALCVHPSQVKIANQAFAASASEIAANLRVRRSLNPALGGPPILKGYERWVSALIFRSIGRILAMPPAPDLLTPSEAAVVAGVPLRAVNRAIDERIVPRRLVQTDGGRWVKSDACAYIRFFFHTAEKLTADERRRVIRIVAADGGRSREVGDGYVTVNFDRFVDEARAREERLRRARDLVVEDDEILDGTPVIKGTRIPVYDVAASDAAGVPRERISAAYGGLDDEAIELATLYAEANPLRGRPRRSLLGGLELVSELIISRRA